MNKKIITIAAAIMLAMSLAACGAANNNNNNQETQAGTKQASQTETTAQEQATSPEETKAAVVTTDGIINSDFSAEAVDTSNAVSLTVESGQDIEIAEAGVYVLSGDAADATVIVNAEDADLVTLVLDGLNITNTDFPCIYVKNAKEVLISTAEGSVNSLSVTGEFALDGEAEVEGTIYSKENLAFSGTGTLNVSSTAHGLLAKDPDDDSVGWMIIMGGTINITAVENGIRAITLFQMDDGTLTIDAEETIEGTVVQINGGALNLTATDDGINASTKSSLYDTLVEINGGDITINMAQGDTDAIDSNGDLVINGGTLNINAQSPFDYDGTATYNGGTLIVNGTQVDGITNQFEGGPGGEGNPFGGEGGPGAPPDGGQAPPDGGQAPPDGGQGGPGGPGRP